MLPQALAVAVNLTETRSTIRAVRQAARGEGMALIGDPSLHRMALPGYLAKPGHRRLRYRPPDGGGPWTPALLRKRSTPIARAVIEEQHLFEADALIAASIAIAGPNDPALATLPSLLRSSLAARDAWGQSLPMIAPLILKLPAFDTPQALHALDRPLRGIHHQGWLVLLDGLTMKSTPSRLLAAAKLVTHLNADDTPIVVARTGPMRRLWLALDFGVEVSLGRLERFKLADYEKSGGGGGAPSPARWEIPELLCSLPPAVAHPLLASGMLSDCSCFGCLPGGTIAERLARAPLHNAAIVSHDIEDVCNRTPRERIQRLEARLRNAQLLSAQLEHQGFDLRPHLSHLRHWPEACQMLRDASLVPDSPRAQLKLSALAPRPV
jgi:hypothetical protein